MALISQLFLTRIDTCRNVEAMCNHFHCDARQTVTSTHQLRCRTQRLGNSSRHQSCQLHHLIIAPSTHHKTARNAHVVGSRTAQANLSKFQQWLTQTFPVCQRRHVFLSTIVHDHIQQFSRFVRRKIGVVANRQNVQRGFQRYRKLTVPTRVGFLSLPQAQRVPPLKPEHLRSHQKIDTLDSNVHVCHRDCNFRFDEGSHRSSMTELSTTIAHVCVPTARAAFARTLATAARRT